MDFSLPSPREALGSARINFLKVFRKSCERTILSMLKTSQSGHPGGSLSSLDILSTLYTFRLTQTHEKIVVSNGHISPAVYSVLAECGVVDPQEVINGFRQAGSLFEGHVTRHIPGIPYGTGPLGIGVSAAAGFAWAEKNHHPENPQKVFALLGDGEAQEGQVHEMALFAAKEKLNNLVVFCDYNQVQLSDSLAKIMPIDIAEFFKAHQWEVYEIDGHDPEAIWEVLQKSESSLKPVMVVAHTIMGKGISLMEGDGIAHKATWHGKTPTPEVIDEILKSIPLSSAESSTLEAFRASRNFKPQKPSFPESLSLFPIDQGLPREYLPSENTDCRSAYGNALQDLGERNPKVLGLTADLGGSVMTKLLQKSRPDQHIECGICEQNMLSVSGALSLAGFIPFCSTFGAFMTSRAKDQARVNDINQTNVKMVATHCGLSVGEDGPTHQAIDDLGSFLGFFNTHLLEPTDPNHCDRMIRFVASHYGNFYVRMGRHKIPVLTKAEDGTAFFDKNYQYKIGKCDLYRTGSKVTIVATGPLVSYAEKARKESGIDAEIMIASSPKLFDEALKQSIQKTKKVIILEDHNAHSGYAAGVALFAAQEGLCLEKFIPLSVKAYQLSGKPEELYQLAGIDTRSIIKALQSF